MPKIIVDGTEYEMIGRDSLSIGELRVVKRYTGVSGDALIDLPDSDPDGMAAIIHILFQRENPALSFAAVEKLVDAIKVATLDYEDEEEVEEVDPPSSSATDASTPSSGTSSSESSEPSPVMPLTPVSGIQGLATGSASGQATSA